MGLEIIPTIAMQRWNMEGVFLLHKSPVFVILKDETTLALDPEIIKEIYVKRAG